MSTKKKILLVDDERDFLESMAERIRLKGFEPILAESGDEALRLAEKLDIDAAVVDFKMPGKDGLEVISALKKLCPGIHTVLLTGFGNEKVKEASAGLNSEYFEKSDMDTFWGFVKNLSRKLEDTMAAAGMAHGGDIDDAYKISHEEEKK
ncbi:response regulator [Desulfovibrio inopinatus]|uniref:response regulator n=1 Tax=Desulfovibrio inopinatus TaxID=102109 RepID=UPI0003F9669E|nr:response regulator [Desulfovibrio inopinatus]